MRAVALVLFVTACAPTLVVRGVVIHRGGLTELEHRGVIGEGFELPVDPHAANSLVVRELDGTVVASELRENVVHVPADRERVLRYVTEGVAEGAPYEVRYRLSVEGDRASLSARALVRNATPFDWRDAEVTLATDDLRGPGGIVWAQVPAPGDADGDHILDAGDRCVDAAETYDGNLDDDGCPDVVIPLDGSERDDSAVRVSFERDGPAPDEEALSEVAALLAGSPIDRLRVVVHGRADEVDGWTLAEARAMAVIEGLVARGVARERLGFSLAFTREEPFASFEILHDAPAARTEPIVDGDRRLATHRTITLARGGETEIELGEEEVRATPILLYRAGLSEASHTERYRAIHRAIQLTLAEGTPRLPGTVEIVIDGVRVGEAALDGAALDGGTAWLPYALDTECAITVEVTQWVEPIVALALEGDDLRAAVHFAQDTTYVVLGPRSAPRWIAHHATPGMTLRELPPGAVSIGEGLFVPLSGLPLTITEVVAGETIVALAELYLAPYLADAPSALAEQITRRQAHLHRVGALALQLFSIWSSVLETDEALSALEATLRAAAPHERPALEEELSRLRAAHAELEAQYEGISQEMHALERLEMEAEE